MSKVRALNSLSVVLWPFTVSGCVRSAVSLNSAALAHGDAAVAGRIQVSDEDEDVTEHCYATFTDLSGRTRSRVSLDETGWVFTTVQPGPTKVKEVNCIVGGFLKYNAAYQSDRLQFQADPPPQMAYFGHIDIQLRSDGKSGGTAEASSRPFTAKLTDHQDGTADEFERRFPEYQGRLSLVPALAGTLPYDPENVPIATSTPGLAFGRMPKWGLGFYLGGGEVALKDSIRDRLAIGNPSAFTFGLTATLWRFFYADTGAGLVAADDHAQFQETACPIDSSGPCNTSQSGVGGVMVWVKGGAQLRVFVPFARNAMELALRGGVGARGVGFTRSVNHGGVCQDCNMQDSTVSGMFLTPEVELGYAFGTKKGAAVLGLRFAYDQYFIGDAMSAFWVSAFGDLLWM